jgi:hypothetical protein
MIKMKTKIFIKGVSANDNTHLGISWKGKFDKIIFNVTILILIEIFSIKSVL